MQVKDQGGMCPTVFTVTPNENIVFSIAIYMCIYQRVAIVPPVVESFLYNKGKIGWAAKLTVSTPCS